MYSKHYAKEVGLHCDDRIVPLKYAVPALGLILAGFGFGFTVSLTNSPTMKMVKHTPTTLSVGQTLASR